MSAAHRTLGVALAAAAVVLPATQAPAQSFQGLGSLNPGNEVSYALGISADGSVVCGYSSAPGCFVPFRWTAASGMINVGVQGLCSGYCQIPYAISGDGASIVGGGVCNAWRWTATGTGRYPPAPGLGYTTALAVNYDGSVAVGKANPVQNYQATACVWTQAGVTIVPNALSANAVSADGLVVAGEAYQGGFRWTAAGGTQNIAPFVASCANVDGSVLAGYVIAGSTVTHAARWTASTGGVSLGMVPGETQAGARGISWDGNVIVGFAGSSAIQTHRATVWTPRLGLADLNAYLPSLGANLSGWTLLEAYGVSADGRTIVGVGTHGAVVHEAWIATLPPRCTADMNWDGQTTTADIFDFLNVWFAGDTRADFNSANGTTVQDIFDFLNAWFAGCP